MNKPIEIFVNSQIQINSQSLPARIEQKLKDMLIIMNPKWEENDKRGYWNGDTPKKFYFLTKQDDTYCMPRGFIHQLALILKKENLEFSIIDETRELPEINFQFQGNLYDFQKKAVKAILTRRFGVFNCPTGGGKTVVALHCIAERKQPSLIIVHTKELMYQWRDRAVEFLGLSEDEIGLLGDGKKEIDKNITISIVNSLYKIAHHINDRIGFLIVDECHRTPSRTFTDAASAFDSKYMLGLSATPYRRDKLTNVIHYYLGNRLYDIAPQELQMQNKIMRAKVKIHYTNFDYNYRGAEDYQPMLTALAEDHSRNSIISSAVEKEAQKNKGISLIISDRKDHCNELFYLIESQGIEVRLLTGDVPMAERKLIIEELSKGSVSAIVATSQLIGEGFDMKSLSSLFLGTPVKFTGRIKQYVGRILRVDKGKDEAIIHDFVDKPGVLQASFKWRLKAYQELGIKEIETEHAASYT